MQLTLTHLCRDAVEFTQAEWNQLNEILKIDMGKPSGQSKAKELGIDHKWHRTFFWSFSNDKVARMSIYMTPYSTPEVHVALWDRKYPEDFREQQLSIKSLKENMDITDRGPWYYRLDDPQYYRIRFKIIDKRRGRG